MLKIALTGADGLVGSRIIELLNDYFIFIPINKNQMDITDKNQVYKTIKSINFDIFLHLAAFTDVDGAEKNNELAYKINVEGTKNVFEVVNHKKGKFIYISTDFVFDGFNPPYNEKNQPNPISYYGKTKYEGEKALSLPNQEKAMIIRISYPYRSTFEKKKDFVRTVKLLLEQKKNLFMVTDSLITPTFIDDIANALKYLFLNYSPEVFHITGRDSLSPYEAGILIAKTFNLDQHLIQPTTYKDYFKNRAKRPQYSQIQSIKNNFYKMKSFEQGLNEVAKQIQNL